MRKAMLCLLIVSLLLTLPGLYQRFHAEWNNRNYETIIPFQDIERLVSEDRHLHIGSVLQRLKQSGLQAVSLEPETLYSMEKKDQIIVLSGERMKEMSAANGELANINGRVHNQGAYIYVQEENELTSKLMTIFPSAETVTIHKQSFIYIPEIDRKIYNETPVGFSKEAIAQIKREDLAVVFRISNSLDGESAYAFKQMLSLSNGDANRILFTGDEVYGYPDPERVKETAQTLRLNNFAVYAIEFSGQLGLKKLAQAVDMNIIRLHSLDLNHIPSLEEGAERAIRAVKERNIRSLYIKAEEGIEAKQALQNAETFIQMVDSGMPAYFHAGKAEAFAQISIPSWSYFCALLSAALFISLALYEILRMKPLFYVSLAGTLALGLLAFIAKNQLFVQGLALMAAVITPIFAIIPISRTKNRAGILLAYGRSILISGIGIMIITALLNGNEFLVKLEAFRGVKLTYIIPIIFVSMFAFSRDFKGLLNMKVRYWHVAVIGVLAVIGFYYISRTGNEGNVSSFELAIRQWLENVLYVRPRTKEFLIGFPFYILALYVYPIYNRLGAYLLIPSVIGFLSIVNTFTHLHIPLYVSMLRTFYGLVFGLAIGLLFIFLFKKILIIFKEKLKPGWQI